MNLDVKRFARYTAAMGLIAAFTLPTPLLAQEQLVSPGELQKQAVAATESRQRNMESLNKSLSTPAAEKALKTAGLDSVKVKAAISTLSDSELARLASRADKAQADFAAGTLSDRDLLLILVGIAALILIIVAVH